MNNTEEANLGKSTPILQTEKALLVRLENGNEIWVPQSVISDDSECYSLKSGQGDLIVAEWWANKQGLEY